MKPQTKATKIQPLPGVWYSTECHLPKENGEYLCLIKVNLYHGKLSEPKLILSEWRDYAFNFDLTMKEKALPERVLFWLDIPKLPL